MTVGDCGVKKRSSERRERSKWEDRVLNGSFIGMMRSSRAMKGTGTERNNVS